VELKVSEIKRVTYNYAEWLEQRGIEKLDEYAYFENLVKKEHPEFPKDSKEFFDKLEDVRMKRAYEYDDYYYDKCDEFLRDMYMLNPDNLELWLYAEKNFEQVKFLYISEDYYKAQQYKEQYGKYPSLNELQDRYDEFKGHKELSESLKNYLFEFESNRAYGVGYADHSYLVSFEDYISASKQIGETHSSAAGAGFTMSYKPEGGDIVFGGTDMYYGSINYTLVHSADPEKTKAWLEAEFSSLSAPKGYKAIITPDSIFKAIIGDSVTQIVSSLIAMAVVLVLMSVCMYFIMRSSLMNRIKEVGVYRAIGVSKKNLAFKFFIEAIVLCVLTVFAGYFVTSAFLYLAMSISSLVEGIFFYPLWYAGAILAVIAAISLLFGTLPILSLLKKTPSEILAKYDI
jgi:hypothetical protein